MRSIITLFLMSFLAFGTLQAQSIQLVLAPNLSPYISDWENTPGAITLIINNTTGADLEVKIRTDLFDGSGALIGHTVAGKMPVLSVPPGVSQYNAEDVFPLSALQYDGNKANIVAQTGRIPDDNYKFCVYLTDPVTNAPIGQSTTTCKPFIIVAYQAPMLIAPRDQEVITPIAVSGTMFRWTPVTPNPGFIVTYRLQIWEVLEGQDNAMALRNNQPIVEKDVRGILQTQWPVDFMPLELDRKYVWTVTPLDDEERKLVDGYGFAQPFGFRTGPDVRSGGGIYGTIEVGDTIRAGDGGEFDVVVKEVTADGDNAFSGKGKVYIKWLLASVAVEFKKIKVDNNLRLLSGGITTQQHAGNPSLETTLQAWGESIANQPWVTGIVGSATNWTNNTINNTVGWVNNNVTAVQYQSNIPPPSIPDNGLKMPLGVTFDINKQDQKLYITEMLFNPDESLINFLAQATFTMSGDETKLGFNGKLFKFHPNAISFDDGRVELAEDVRVPNKSQNPTAEFIFLKGGVNSGCYMEWQSNGLTGLGLGVDVEFTRDWLLPVPAGNATSKVKASFSGNGTGMDDIILTGNLPNCEIVGTNGLKIQLNQMTLDLSDTRNPAGLKFPDNYSNPNTGPDWHGFYMKSFNATMPETWKTGSNQSPPSISATDLIIDKFGITTKIKALNVLNLQSGSVANLAASLDTVEISIKCSSLESGKAKGKLVIPISDEKDQNTLKYTATFAQPSGHGQFQIIIVPYQDIEASVAKAKMTLEKTSTITASITAGTIAAAMTLHGKFKWDNPNFATASKPGGIKGVKMELSFESLGMDYTYITSTNNSTFNFNPGKWSFASPQKRFANFPVTIKKIYYKSMPNGPGSGGFQEVLNGALMIDVVANLTEDIGGSTSIGAKFGVSINKAARKFKPEYKGISVDKIKVQADMSAVKINGSLDFRDNDPVYGDGFKATLSVTFNAMSLQVNALTEFGNTSYGSTDGLPYRYWRVEADVKLPVGVPFLTGVGFYGFGGGAFYNMTSKNITSIANPGSTTFTFEPKKSQLGFKVMATVGTMPKFETFNTDVELLAQFSTSGGLTQIQFLGNFWLAASMADRPKAQMKGSVFVSYNFPDKLFNMCSALSVNVPPAITTPNPVGFVMKIDGRANKWYIKAGTPDVTNTVKIFGLDLYSYLMVGNDIPTPNGFTPRFANNYRNATGYYPNNSNVGSGGVGGNTASGKGFATGVGIEFSKYIGQELYTGECRKWSVGGKVLAGAELNLALMHQTGCEGINGYRASGNLGLYGSVNASITGTSFKNYCDSKNYNLFKIQAGAWVSGKFPNTEYITGALSAKIQLFKVNNKYLCECNYYGTFEKGTDCIGTEVTVNNAPKEDKAEDFKNKLIQYIAPNSPFNFPVKSPVNVKYGLTPGQMFDVAENQGDGTIKNRTFMMEITTTLEVKKADGTWAGTNLQSKVNNMGEYQYYRNGSSSLVKVTYDAFKVKAAGIVQKTQTLIQMGNTMSSASTSADWDKIYQLRYELSVENYELVKLSQKYANDLLEFAPPTSMGTAQTNISNLGALFTKINAFLLNMDRGDKVQAGEGKGSHGFDYFITTIGLLKQYALDNQSYAQANWQLAVSNAGGGASGPVGQSSASVPAVHAGGGNSVVGSSGQITVSAIPAALPSAPEPNYPNPEPPTENNLDKDRDYRFVVVATLKELVNYSWVPAMTASNSPLKETKTFAFRTGSMPIASANPK
jgi:hypothetical protein